MPRSDNQFNPLCIAVTFYGKPKRGTPAYLGSITLGRGLSENAIYPRLASLVADDRVMTEDKARVKSVATALDAASFLVELTEGPVCLLRFPPQEVSA